MSFNRSNNEKSENNNRSHEVESHLICNFNKIVNILNIETSNTPTPIAVRGFEKLDQTKPSITPAAVSHASGKFSSRGTSVSSSCLDLVNVVGVQRGVLEKHHVSRLFVHGNYLKKPLESIKDALFPKEVHDGLRELHIRTIYRTQSHSWPNILEGRSVFIVNGSKSGKTFSYLPAILALIASEEPRLSSSFRGPIGIIIARSSKEVEILAKLCSKLLPREKMGVVKAFGKWNCEKTRVDLLNGCDLFITTPPCFARLAESEVIKLFDKKRIKHCVFDGIDTMLEMFDKEIKLIIKTCTSGDEHPDLNPQLIVTSLTWVENIRQFMNLVCDPIVIMGSFIEAALYAKCRFKVSKGTRGEKLEDLRVILSTEKWKSKKMLIIVNNETEINFLSHFLRQTKFEYEVFDSLTTLEHFQARYKLWDQGGAGFLKILIASDETLISCKVTGAYELIHFSLPDSWSRFSLRFATLSNCLMNFVEQKSTDRAIVRIMLDEENSLEIPRLIEFLTIRRVVKISEDIIDLVEVGM